jgi:hypothetical protein
MNRRTFVTSTLAASMLLPQAGKAEARDEEAIVRERLMAWYRAFANPKVDRAHYLSFTTQDYLLLENGELLDRAGDLALLDDLPADLVRTDRFDFRRVAIDGNRADLVYFLDSAMNDAKNGPRTRRWLESAVMRREGGNWRCALLHSTRITAS